MLALAGLGPIDAPTNVSALVARSDMTARREAYPGHSVRQTLLDEIPQHGGLTKREPIAAGGVGSRTGRARRGPGGHLGLRRSLPRSMS